MFSKKTGDDQQEFPIGALKDKSDRRDFRLAGIVAGVEIPKQVFRLEETYPPKQQWVRSSCTCQAQAHHKERQENVPLSARFIMALVKEYEGNKNWGAYTRNGFKIVKDVGAAPESIYPEPGPEMSWDEYLDTKKIPDNARKKAAKHKSSSFWRVENNIDDLRLALTKNKNSVVCSFPWYREWNRPNVAGHVTDSPSSPVGGHAIECVGFDDFASLVWFKNSWGKSWGKDGFFSMSYQTFNEKIWDMWTSLDLPEEMPVDDRYGKERNFLSEKTAAFNPWLIKKIGRLPNNREINALVYGVWDFETVFKGANGDTWLKITKSEAKKNGLIK